MHHVRAVVIALAGYAEVRHRISPLTLQTIPQLAYPLPIRRRGLSTRLMANRDASGELETDTKGSKIRGIGWCSGTFGELLQGILPGEERGFLVTLPIARYSSAVFTAAPGHSGVYVYPPHKEKSRHLALELIRHYSKSLGGKLLIQSDLQEGKGFASSSADMVATALAVQSALGFAISRNTLARIMSRIEPSDGVMYQGIVSFYHQEGVLRKLLGYLPPLTIVAVDEGGRVDTIRFNKSPEYHNRNRYTEYENLLAAMERAVLHKDLASIGEISTRSAVMNQEILPKESLNRLLDLRERHGTLGVVIAHSGTCLGLLLNPSSSNYLRSLSSITAELAAYSPEVNIYYTHNFQRTVPQQRDDLIQPAYAYSGHTYSPRTLCAKDPATRHSSISL